MKKIFVDTNYFLRFLIKNDSAQRDQVEKLFEKALEEKIQLFSNSIVIFEIYWVLTSFYQQKKKEALKTIKDVLSLSFISFQERKLLLQAIKLSGSCTLELEDCYHLHYLIDYGAINLATFDKRMIKQAQKLKLSTI